MSRLPENFATSARDAARISLRNEPTATRCYLRLGCLDTPILERPKLHMWRSESASWFDPKDQLPEFPEAPPQK